MKPIPRRARAATLLFVAFALSFPFLALAQEAAPAPPDEVISVRGYVLTGIASLAGLAFTGLMAAGALAVSQKSKDGAAWALVNRLYNAAQTAAAHVEAEMRPAIQRALADGKLTPEEAAELKARGLEVLKLVAGEALENAPKTLGIPAEAMPAFLSGLLERGVKALKVKPSSVRVTNTIEPKAEPRE